MNEHRHEAQQVDLDYCVKEMVSAIRELSDMSDSEYVRQHPEEFAQAIEQGWSCIRKLETEWLGQGGQRIGGRDE